MLIASQRALAQRLGAVAPFATPKARLEQYPTPSAIAAELLWHAHMRADLHGRRIIDLGCGGGIFGIGALLLDAQHVAFVDIDPAAIALCERNLASLIGSDERAELIGEDARRYDHNADLLFMNPPFGVRQPHADRAFLDSATRLAPIIYTLHLRSTATYVERFLTKAGYRIEERFVFRFALANTLAGHTRVRHDVDVIAYRAVRPSKSL